MTAAEQVLRYSAFTDTPAGGNPAGVVLDARNMADARMLELAAEIGYSETAFLTPRPGGREYDVRYFSAEAEVPFCGHATIATAVALAERDGHRRPRLPHRRGAGRDPHRPRRSGRHRRLADERRAGGLRGRARRRRSRADAAGLVAGRAGRGTAAADRLRRRPA